ncbi:molybdenum cofactor biosynthesis protein MoaE [Actomonas aquatica]|uniref:Molybdopterin synthase catalytic subunit n=1 Tax=Actomonas aquatica TaxID=2866162 RepID=A0ABZ1C4M9_9BACT|nr:molybdenum cofactor biosynthesis protein MoaE [Opitutus sp. WL0086]WRQ86198.1 molybdenum cofactor biosynthesis protein MoaE [Opitutus sp. WL0086]
MAFKISDQPIDPAPLATALDHPRAGACATFEGRVRNHNEGQPVDSLEYEAFAELAEREGERVLAEALEKFDLLAAEAVHRVGHLQIGDMAVWVGVAAAHRGPAFDACRYIIDELKARVPIWKKEHYSSGATTWINCATRGDFADASPPLA